ncbi:hypothetical protein ND861_12900 [Leptospira sp. 2 VSF19]|uniref:Lipoprotein n=1 Tax=Leptospira soteropolitanensis TaxID=2950025 RepID=A0AAW5VF48_9LEPT|nr:hypothetical protein [Leptospira soteropolitanensis]MCW7493540.1 hypothetical protein [Leptospira soteropolitanensis]MCW7500928.1 hypothetical protein [Leptospira soteropolitanensis]MCW7523392.1 hypothetical protein [Leptospira soteropolitanensis]MCW7527253.1 hypothetical protein [Leptospira soteropolitanensis]MCW7531110.1 hypothetical protein [Leptospira soteropolitanensis]
MGIIKICSYLLFTLLLISCNNRSTKDNISALGLLGILGNQTDQTLDDKFQTLDDKFQSLKSTTYYRKDGNLQFQDILIEYQLKNLLEGSETIEAYLGNPSEISFDLKTKTISGYLNRKEDQFQTNSILFSFSDHTKKFKIILTLKKEGKIISYREILSTPPNPPTIPPNAIALPAITYETKRSLIGGTEYQVIRVKFQLGADLSQFIKLDAYIGRPTIIALAPDNYNVINYISATYYNSSSNEFLFLTPELNSSYKIFVVGATTDAKGNRSLDTIPPPPPPSPCQGSVNAPTTIGNCSTHCLVVDLAGNQMSYIAKSNIESNLEYIYLDATSSTPSGGSGPANFSWTEHESPIGAGEYQTENRTFDVTTYPHACMIISSYLVKDGPSGFSDHYINGKVNVP